MNDPTFKRGDQVIYTQCRGREAPTEWGATYVRSQITSGRLMHVIQLDAATFPRQVGANSIRPMLVGKPYSPVMND